ncbi:single-stranded DNA-binding protein [Staphylococcus aureus]
MNIIRCVAFGKTAEIIAKLNKGNKIGVTGSIQLVMTIIKDRKCLLQTSQ